MSALPKTFRLRAQAHGEAVAHHEFAVMLNPKYRGGDFKWEGFVPFAVRWAQVSVWQGFTDREWNKWESELKDAAGLSAKYAAERLLKDSGILEWWPDPTRAARAPTPLEGEHAS